ncbi:TonB-dependent receptor [Flavobacterium frigoris]|uniref:TonB-dependent receptor n=1 Tax=Flavobacterium frigoris (strain PS1) TaxID=1086011 RepID=H7FN00_FLAFP|nr:carboxypeptidase-like regulatory domain-containing protein [Flavobacterium frigoris]EIA10134.1 tonB-dependent receptor [Flavobacterium frigoris PS1]
MKTFKNWLLSGLLFLVVGTAFSQGKITGTITDGQGSLPGANVAIKGTKIGASADFDGKFSISSTVSTGELVLSFIGFEPKTIKFSVAQGATQNLGNIVLISNSNELSEIVVIGRGIIDLAKDRKTAIAVSTIRAEEIQAKIGASDVIQALVNTPSVYVAGQAGGYGDSRISVRGFAQDNTAFLLNGQPINGMEDGKMYWSNWSGMSDIASIIQIQRGLGSSKLAISSVGGTVNFVTKATDKKQGGFASFGQANDNYFKSTIAYNTGMSKSGWGTSVLFSHWQGDGYNDGTKGQGQNYFISVGYKANDKHSFNFILTGAPQTHDQNYGKRLSDFEKYGRKYNNNWGTLNGEYLSAVGNYYHKPVANLNWDFDINDKSSLSTVLYASWGRGGSVGTVGSIKRTATDNVDFDATIAANQASATGAATGALRNSVNNHAWYGMVTNFKTELTESINFNMGLDLRTYKGTHFRQLTNLLGADYYLDKYNVNIPNNKIYETNTNNAWAVLTNTASVENRYSWDYDETISYGGFFSQIEYAKDNVSAFFQGAVSNQSHERFDRYAYLPADAKSEKVNNVGYNVKAGGSYKIGGSSSFYVNAGYYSRQPYHDNIYLNFGNEVNPLTKNEKVIGLEAGYSFKSQFLSGSINAYRTSWKDRVTTSSNEVDNDLQYTTNEGVEQLHSGLELDFVAKPFSKLDISGFASVGDYHYVGDAVKTVRDSDRNILSSSREDVDGGKVGDAAQVTIGLGFKYEIATRFSIDADWRNYEKLYANVGSVKNNVELPSYDLVDTGLSYKMLTGKDKNRSVVFRINVNNVFDEIYVSELTTNIAANPGDVVINGLNASNKGYYGFGRTWNASMRFNF